MQPIPILMAAPTVLISFLSWTLQPAGAGVLDRIAEEGVMRAGTRASTAPFAWKTAAGTFKGFSVDLLKEFRAAAEKTAGRPVRLELFEVTPADRLQRVASQELDIVCGITTPTWSREKLVDFSLPFFRDGTRVMMYRSRAFRGLDLNRLPNEQVSALSYIIPQENASLTDQAHTWRGGMRSTICVILTPPRGLIGWAPEGRTARDWPRVCSFGNMHDGHRPARSPSCVAFENARTYP